MLTSRSAALVAQLLGTLDAAYAIVGDVAVHHSAIIEPGAIIKGPAVIGARCFVAAGAYVRDGCWLEADCILGPGAELKSSLVFAGSKLAHFNFVGDSIIGARVNIEAGAIIANYRNEQPEPAISIMIDGQAHATGADKFGALVGDGCRIGANAVIAPGAILAAASVVPRLALVDQSPAAC
ncbi:MAG: transferase [Polymorphobacter sp.]